uniref:RING finger protein 44 n=1 Tax=Aegilops tauschii TaxID=37682 RepID=M8BMA6_AEGTA
MEDLDVNTPPNNDEQDDISCVPSPSDTDDDDDRGDEEEAARQDDDDNDDTDDDVDPDNMTYEERQELVESVGNESRGLSDELLSYLVPWKYRSGSGFFSRKTNHDDTCTVCLSAFRNRENIITLPCKHNYHASCISSWLKINRVREKSWLCAKVQLLICAQLFVKQTCPVCKYEVFGPS